MASSLSVRATVEESHTRVGRGDHGDPPVTSKMGASAEPDYDVFISYRRLDAARVAHRLRERLLSYRLPPSFASSRRKLSVYLDSAYEQATEDFFEDTICPALAGSRALIVVQTPGAAARRSDGSENWVAREVQYFRSLPGPRKTWVALGVGDFSDPLPADLQELLPNIERVDVRGLARPLGSLSEAELVKFVGPIYGIPPEEGPTLRREEERRSRARRRRLAAVAASVCVALALLSVAALLGWRTAATEARTQRAMRLASDAVAAPGREVDLSLLLAAEALETTDTPETRRALTRVLSDHPRLVGFFHCGAHHAYDVAYLEPSDVLVVSCDQTLVGWELESRRHRFRIALEAAVRRLIPVEERGLLVGGLNNWLITVDDQGRHAIFATPHTSSIQSLARSHRADADLVSRDSAGTTITWRIAKEGRLVPVENNSPQREDRFAEPSDRSAHLPACPQTIEPAFRTSSHFLERLDLELAAFATEDNVVAVSFRDECLLLEGNTHNLASLRILADSGPVLLASAGQVGRGRFGAIVWNLDQPHPLATRLATEGRDGPSSVALSDDGGLAVVSRSQGIDLRNLKSGTLVRIPVEGRIKKIAISPERSEIALLDYEGRVRLLKTRGPVDPLAPALEGKYDDLSYDSSGELHLLADSVVRLHLGQTQIRLPTPRQHESRCDFLSSEGQMAVYETDAGLQVFETRSGKSTTYQLPPRGPGPADCSRADLIGERYVIRLVNTYDANPIEVLDLHSDSGAWSFLQNPFTRRSGLSSDLTSISAGRRSRAGFAALSTVEHDRILLLNVLDPRLQGELEIGKQGLEHNPGSGIKDLAADASMNRLVTVGSSGLLVWDLKPRFWVERARQIAGRELTLEERATHLR